ncbi:MAG: hypothetical protein KTR22_04090 [Flavobacteriaceae bacterium]|nr:hypothetical protein [Flavobacteriaceae bacterium]
MYRLVLSAFALSFFLVSCNSDNGNGTVQDNDPANFYALTVGNTWEYEVSRYNATTEEYELQDLRITNTITDQTKIGGETYFVFTTTTTGDYECESCVNCFRDEIVRDSLGYLINDQGTILFSNSPTEDFLIGATPWGGIYGEYSGSDVDISTPAGDFQTYQNEIYGVLSNGDIPPSRDVHQFAENVGRVQRTVSLLSQSIPWHKMVLRSYTLED